MSTILEQLRRPDVSFSRNGIIRITARVAKLLKLRPGDSINIKVDKGEFFLFAINSADIIGRVEARCYPTKKRNNNYCANSVHLCRSFLDTIGLSVHNAKFAVGAPINKDGTIYIPIITRRPL